MEGGWHLRSSHGAEHPITRETTQLLTRLLSQQGKGLAALPLLRSLHGDRHPRTMQAISAVVMQLQQAGRPEEAEPLAREAAELRSTAMAIPTR